MKRIAVLIAACLPPLFYMLIQNLTQIVIVLVLHASIASENPSMDALGVSKAVDDFFAVNFPYIMIISALAALLVLYTVFKLIKIPLESFVSLTPIGSRNLAVKIFALGAALNIFCVTLTDILPVPQEVIDQHQTDVVDLLGGAGLWAMLASSVIIIPIIEEIIFRGVSYNILSSAFSPVFAVIIQALIFAAVHSALLQKFYVFLPGLLLGVVYRRTRTLRAPILMHIAFNANLLSGTIPESFAAKIVYLIVLASIIFVLTGSIARRSRSPL